MRAPRADTRRNVCYFYYSTMIIGTTAVSRATPPRAGWALEDATRWSGVCPTRGKGMGSISFHGPLQPFIDCGERQRRCVTWGNTAVQPIRPGGAGQREDRRDGGEHFASRGYRRIGFAGCTRPGEADTAGGNRKGRVEARGLDVLDVPLERIPNWASEEPVPMALLASNDAARCGRCGICEDADVGTCPSRWR
jgi:hypothetical protein